MHDLPFIWNGKTFYIVGSKYESNNNTALLVTDHNGLRQATATANLGPLPAHRFYIKNHSENKGLQDVLLAHQIIAPCLGEDVSGAGFCFEQFTLTKVAAVALKVKLPKPPETFVLDIGASQEVVLPGHLPKKEAASPAPDKAAKKKRRSSQ